MCVQTCSKFGPKEKHDTERFRVSHAFLSFLEKQYLACTSHHALEMGSRPLQFQKMCTGRRRRLNTLKLLHSSDVGVQHDQLL